MARRILEEARIHPEIRDRIANYRDEIVREVEAAVVESPVVVIGMRHNPFPAKARGLLEAAGVRYRYFEYGSDLRDWRRRLALRMWAGWPTFPMVFVKGVLVGGASELEKLIASGELREMLAES